MHQRYRTHSLSCVKCDGISVYIIRMTILSCQGLISISYLNLNYIFMFWTEMNKEFTNWSLRNIMWLPPWKGCWYIILSKEQLMGSLEKFRTNYKLKGKKGRDDTGINFSFFSIEVLNWICFHSPTDENSRAVVESEDFATTFLGLLGSGNPDISRLCVALLFRLTESSVSRQCIITSFDNAWLVNP